MAYLHELVPQRPRPTEPPMAPARRLRYQVQNLDGAQKECVGNDLQAWEDPEVD